MSDESPTIASEKLGTFYKKLVIEQEISSSYHCHINGEAEAWIKFLKHAMKKCFYSDAHVNLAVADMLNTTWSRTT